MLRLAAQSWVDGFPNLRFFRYAIVPLVVSLRGKSDDAILPLGGLEQPGAAVTTTIGMFLTEVVLFAIGLLISSLVRTYKNAARLGAGVLLGFYGLYVIADYLEMPALHYLTPLKYFDVYAVARGGFSVSFLMISIVIVICAVVKSQRSWANREI